MSIVIGDHVRSEFDTTKTSFVVLLDNIKSGGILSAFTSEGELHDTVDIVPPDVDGPARIVICVPVTVTILRLKTRDGLEATAKLDHRDEIGVIYAMSCDHLEADTDDDKSMWSVLDADIDESAWGSGRCICLHLGDNIYGDTCWNESKPDREYFNRVLDRYRNRYRETWFGSQPRINVYSKASHLMICDDHEVRNDYMNTPVKGKYMNIYGAAMQAYSDYQESLLYTVERSMDIGRGWIRMIRDDLIVTIDRSHGIPKMCDVVNVLAPIISKYSPKGIILAMGWGVVPSPRGNTYANMYRGLAGAHKFMSDDELSVLYNYLFTVVALGISVVVLGGDLHFGVHGTVSNDTGSYKFDVVISSPITNHPTTDRKMAAKGYRNHSFKLDSGISFLPHSAKARRCYAKIAVKSSEGYDPERYIVNMVYSKYKHPSSYARYFHSLSKMA